MYCTDGRTTCANTVIPTGREWGLPLWINLITSEAGNCKDLE